MLFSVATASLYFCPFEQTLEIIAEADFKNIELDLFWEKNDYAMAQHLRNVPIKKAVNLIKRSGLKISSIHDGGGLLENNYSTEGFINPSIDKYLNELGYAPECLVFHTPHIKGRNNPDLWKKISDRIVCSIEKYRKVCSYVTIENNTSFKGYYVPLTSPEELNEFATQNELGITFDTTHYADIGIDIIEAAKLTRENIKTIHLSDFVKGRKHVFIGEGELDLKGFFEIVDKNNLSIITLECSLSSINNPDQFMNFNEMVSRLKEGKTKLMNFLK
ncbi:MAG: sugar phosphate isomerase/epimerase [Sphingobacteriia bacterium]|nr:sugar phosphate isomerase/epimerase [Sphingobacteriia bacterium]